MRIRTEEGMPVTLDDRPFAGTWTGATLRMAPHPADPSRMLYREPTVEQALALRQPAPAPAVVGEAGNAWKRYAATMANDEPYRYIGLGVNDKGYLSIRWFEARLTMRPAMFATRLGKPEGMPLAFQHAIGWSFDPAPVGRVESARIEGSEMVGAVDVSEAALRQFVPGGFADLERGICKGLSIGFSLLEPPKVTRKEGTMSNPDLVRIGRVRLRELSLVPVPALAGCGLGATLDEDAGDDAGLED